MDQLQKVLVLAKDQGLMSGLSGRVAEAPTIAAILAQMFQALDTILSTTFKVE